MPGSTALNGQRIVSDRDFCAYLLETGKVAVRGSAFGASPFFRISYASSRADLEDALLRIVCVALR